jgi:hypothetical protein
MKDLLKINKIKTSPSLIVAAIRSISNAVEENFLKMKKVAERRSNDYIGVSEDEIKINNTVLTPRGLVIMVDEDSVDDNQYMIGIFRTILSDLFKLKSPSSKYFSKRFREIMSEEFS